MKQLQAALNWLRRFRVANGALLAIVCALWGARVLISELPGGVGRSYQKSPISLYDPITQRSGQGNDDDSVRIEAGLAEKPTFISTFGYWTGSWAGGDLGPPTPFGPYFRPLTSQLWWLERHFAGPNSQFVFLLVHLFWHLCFTLALWACLRVWWSDKGALLSIWLWCMGAPYLVNAYAAPFEALRMWKDDPEMTVGLCVLGAMMATRAFVLTNHKKWIVLAFSLFALSLSFKESGYMTPFFVLFALWRFGATRHQWRVAPLFFVGALLAFLYRMWALHGLGGYHGHNGSWWMRGTNELGGGLISASLWPGNSMALCVAALIMAVFAWLRAHRKIAIFWIGMSIAALVWAEVNASDAWLELCDISFTSPVYIELPYFLLTLALWQLFVLRRPPAMLWGYIWVVLAYLPLLKQVVTGHGFYFFSTGWALWLAGALAYIYSQSKNYLRSEFKTAFHETYSRINPRLRRPKAPGAT